MIMQSLRAKPRATRGSSARVDQVLMASVKDRERIERAGWFN